MRKMLSLWRVSSESNRWNLPGDDLCQRALNGPCGGMVDGHCEVDEERDCAWVKIYQRLTLQQRDIFSQVVEPKDWSRKFKPGSHDLKKDRDGRGRT